MWFALLVGTGCGVAGGVIGATDGVIGTIGLGVFGFLVGTGAICSHIAADAVTPMRVQPLVPVDERHISYNITRASNPLANYVLLALGVVMAAVAVLFGELLDLAGANLELVSDQPGIKVVINNSLTDPVTWFWSSFTSPGGSSGEITPTKSLADTTVFF